MGRAKKTEETSPLKPIRPVESDEARENQMISLAIDLAEKQLRDGTASSQVIVHYLKLGSTKDRLEKEIMGEQAKLYKAKADALASQKRVEELYADALKAMRTYTGGGDE